MSNVSGNTDRGSRLRRTVATLVILATCSVLFNPSVTAYALTPPAVGSLAAPFAGLGNPSTNSSVASPLPSGPTTPGYVAPGTVMQGNSSILPASASLTQPVTVETVLGINRFTTSYGQFTIDPAQPWALNAADRGWGTNVETFFTAVSAGILLIPGSGTVTASANGAVLRYGLYDGSALQGTMTVQVEFGATTDKITVNYAQLVGSPASTQLAWIGFTNFALVATANPASSYTNIASFVPMFGVLRVGNLTLFATGTSTSSAERDVAGTGRTLLDSTDASGAVVGNFVAAGVHVGSAHGNALVTLYAPGALSFDPILVASPASGSGQFSDQRYTFYDGQRYWAFWYNSATYGIEYSNTVDGRTWTPARNDVPGRTFAGDTLGLTLGFTVLNKGTLVEVIWANTNGGTSATQIMLSSGAIQNDQIVWAKSTANVLATASTSYINEPVTATFTSAGEIAFAYVLFGTPSNNGPGAYYGRYACQPSSYACSNGYTNVVQVSVGIASSLLPDSFSIAQVVAVPGPQDGVMVYFSGVTGRTDSNLWFYGDYSPQSPDTNANIDCLGNVTWTNNIPAAPVSAVLALAPFFAGSLAFVSQTTAGLAAYYIGANCVVGNTYNPLTATSAGNSKYLTAAEEPGDQAVDILWENTTTGYIQGDIVGDVGVTSISIPWATGFGGVTGISASLENEGQFFSLSFVQPGNPQNVFFASLPTHLDLGVGPNDPWIQEPNAPLFSEFGGSMNPATGLLKAETEIVSYPGTKLKEGLSLIYEQPSLFYGGSPYILPRPYYAGQWYYGYAVTGVMWTDLPWLDVGGEMLHMPGGASYHYVLDSITASANFTGIGFGFILGLSLWFKNTVGLQFTMQLRLSNFQYTVYLTNGDTYVFGPYGNLLTFVDASGNALNYRYDANHRLYLIQDSAGRGITIGYSGTSSQICSVSYGSAAETHTATFSYGGSPCASGSSTSVTITDIAGRKTTYATSGGLLNEVDFPTGGRVTYTYGSVASGSIVEGSDLYELPLLEEAIYNQSAYNVLTRSDQFNYQSQDGRVTDALLNYYDASGVLQGSTEYQFHSEQSYGTARVIDHTGQVLAYDMSTGTTGGAMVDLSGNRNNGTANGLVAAPGMFGMGRLFSGLGANITAGNGASVNINGKTLSLSAWIDPRTSASQEIIINKENSYEVALLNGILQAAVQIAGGPTWAWGSSGYAVPVNTWSQVAFVYDGHLPLSQQWSFYVNGILVSQIAPPGGVTGNIGTSASPLRIGIRSAVSCSPSPLGCPFNGTMDSLHLYNRALTSDEVYSLFVYDAVQRSLTKSWFSPADGQPSRTEVYMGASQTPTSVTANARDTWGNVIYSQDAYGNSSYASYANTNSQGRFYQAGSLVRTSSGQVFADDFSTGTSDFITSISGTSMDTVTRDGSVFDQSPPSLRVSAPGGSGSSSVTLTKTFSTSQASAIVAEAEFRFDANQISSSAVFYWNIDTGSGVAIDLAFSGGSLIAYLGNNNWATCGGYAANLWTRVTIVFTIGGAYNVYMNGGLGNCNTLVPLHTGAVVGMHFALSEGVNSVAASAWVDDIAVANSDTVTVGGLVPGEKVFLDALNGNLLTPYQVTGSTATLTFNRAHPIGQATITISGVDSSTEYQTPFVNIFGGDTYTFSHPANLDDRLTRTRSGFGYWGSTIVDGTAPSGTTYQGCPVVGSTTIPCDFHWGSVPTVTGNQVLQNSYVATNETGYEFVGNLWTPQASDYYAQYLYVPSQYDANVLQSPAELRLVPVSYYTNTPFPGYATTAPTWGLSSSAGFGGIECFAICLYGGQTYLGDFPNITNGWAKFVFKGTDLFQAGVQLNEYGMFFSNGQGVFGPLVKGDSSMASVTVSGLSYYTGAPNEPVTVFLWDDGGRLISTGQASGGADSISLALDPGTTGVRISAYPFQGRITMRIASGAGTTPIISNETLTIWGGDSFRFMGASGFYDANAVQAESGLRNALMGTAQPYGDCLDAVACYDMETVRSDPAQSIGSGSVQNYMVDLSRHANDAALNDVSLGPGVVGQSAALDGVDDYVQAPSSTSLQVTGDITISMWVDLSRNPDCDTNNNWRSMLTKLTSGGGDFGSYYVFLEQNSLPSWSVTVGGVAQREFPPVGAIPVGSWTHLVFTRAASTGVMQYYENGVLMNRTARTAGAIDTSTGALRIGSGTNVGASCPNGDGAFPGSIDQVVIYPKVLTPTQIAALYTAKTPLESRTVFGSTLQGLVSSAGVLTTSGYLTATYSYNSHGELTVSSINNNRTYSYYASFYNSAYLTRLQRADGKNILYSYDNNTGLTLGAVNPDCTRTRTVYDTAGRATQVLNYNVDPQSVLYLDMETVFTTDTNTGAWNWDDLSCTEATTSITSNRLSAATSIPGPQGMAQAFDGSTTYIEVPDSANLKQQRITVSAWIKPTSFPTGAADIVDRSYPSATPSGYVLFMNANASAAFAVADGTAFHTSTSTAILQPNVWQLVTGVYDGSHVTVYVNNHAYDPVAFTGSISYAQTQALIVGCSYQIYAFGSCSRFFPGGIDEVHVLTTGLPATSIPSLYTFQWGLLSSRANAYDDMTIITGGFGGGQLAGYQYPSMTQYDPTSVPRSLYYDMQTQLLVTTGGVHVLEDLSGNGQDGTLQGTSSTQNLPTFVPGKVGQALKFQSANTQWIDIHTSQPSSLNLTQAVSVAAWVNITGSGSVDTVLAKGYFTSLQYDLDVHLQSGGSWVVGASLKNAAGTTVALTSATAIPVNRWTHVAFTYDGYTVRIYVNGAQDANSASLQAPLALSIYDATVGVFPNSPTTYFFDGMIDELQVFPVGLTSAQILAVYQGTDTSHMVKRYFDGIGRLTRTVLQDFAGHKIAEETLTLGWNDVPKLDTLANGQSVLYTYNFLGGASTVTGPAVNGVSGQSESLLYDMQQKTVVIDPIGRISYTKTDRLGRTAETGGYNPANGTYNRTTAGYNALGLQVTADVLLPSGAKQQGTTTFYYNSAGKVVFTIYPDGGNSSIVYDSELRVVSETDPIGHVVSYTYVSTTPGAGLGWVASITLKAKASAATGYTTTVTYDSSDNVYQVNNGTTTLTRTYTPLHQLKTETFATAASGGGNGATLAMGYVYDSAGRIISISYPGSNTANYTYDYFGRIAQVLYGAGTTPKLYASLGYDSAGRLSKIWYDQAAVNTSVAETFLYDAMSRVSGVKVAGSSAGYLNDTYTYDLASQVTQVVDDMFTGHNGASNPKTETFAYDANGRLEAATGPWSPSTAEGAWGLQYTYDAVGNIKSLTQCSGGTFPCPSGSTTNYVYNYANWNQLTSLNGATTDSFTYNGDGSILGRVGYAYVYDLSQRLVKVTDSASTVHAYSYDALGRRVSTQDTVLVTTCQGKTCTTNPVTYANYFAYGGGKLTYTVNQTSGVGSVYVYVGGMLLFRADSSASATAHFYTQDASNNVRLIWNDASGTVAVEAKLRYMPFGQEAKDIVAGSSLLKFDGQQIASNLPLYYLGARYYDPALGRFLSRDPTNAHGYVYANDNPVSYQDPTGLITQGKPVLSGIGQKLDAAMDAYARAVQQAQNDANNRKILLAIITIIAVVVLTVVTCGADAPFILLIAVGVGAAFAAEQYFVAGVHDPVQLFSDFATGFAVGAAVAGGVAALADSFEDAGVDLVGADLQSAEMAGTDAAGTAAESTGEAAGLNFHELAIKGIVGGVAQSGISISEDVVCGKPIEPWDIGVDFMEGFGLGVAGDLGEAGGGALADATGLGDMGRFLEFAGKVGAVGGLSMAIGYSKGTHSLQGLLADATIGVAADFIGDASVGGLPGDVIGGVTGEALTCSIGLPDCQFTGVHLPHLPVPIGPLMPMAGG